MRKYAALLRAVNVGGTGKLPMAELRKMCADAGFQNAKPLLASGNVVFETTLSKQDAHTALSVKLRDHFGTNIGLFILDGAQMRAVYDANPFSDHPPSQIGVLFVNDLPTQEDCRSAKGLKDEVMISDAGVLFIKFPSGMGKSKLAVPSANKGTMRNMNTVRKLSELLNE